MLKRQSTVIPSLLTRITSSVNHLSKMPCYAASSDPFCKRLFHTRAKAIDLRQAFPFSPRSNSLEISRYGGGFASNNGKSNGLTLKGCYDSHKTVDQKARALAQHRQLLRGPETSPEHNGANLANGRGAYQPGKPFGFPGSDKIVVAVDVDEVLGNFVSALNKFIADRYSMDHSVSEYHVYEFFKIWNCSRDEAAHRVHEFFKTQYFKKGIQPIPGAHQALHKLSRFCNLSVVTSRQNVIKDHTIEWIEKHFPGMFEEIHFGNHFALNGGSRPKADICRSIGAEILIDDNPGYAVECAEVGMKVLLFDYENSYPWCKTEMINKHPLVTKVYNWEEVEENIVSWAVSKR